MTVRDPAFVPFVAPRVGAAQLDVRAEIERARVRGYADGYAEGRRLAREEAHAAQAAFEERTARERDAAASAVQAALTAVARTRDELERRAAALAGAAADRIEELAVDLATLVVGVELSDDGRSAAHALRRALTEMPAEQWVRVAFAPEDLAVLSDDRDARTLLDGIEVRAESGIGRGGALVEVEHGAVDTRIDGAFARASAVLRGGDDDGTVTA